MFLTPSHPFKCLLNNILLVHTAWENVVLNRCCREGKCDHGDGATGWALTTGLQQNLFSPRCSQKQFRTFCLQPQYIYSSKCSFMRSTSSAETTDALWNTPQGTLLPSFICSSRLSCYISRWPKPQTPKVLDDLNIWSEAHTSNDLHLARVSVSIKSLGLDAVCEILKLTLKRHQSEV